MNTLSEQGVLWKAFGDMANNVLVKDAREGNSIIVTCYVPKHIMDILLMEAKKNLDMLIKMGLIQLTIGYHTMWNEHTRDDVRDECSTRQLM